MIKEWAFQSFSNISWINCSTQMIYFTLFSNSIQFNVFVMYGHQPKIHTIQYNNIWVTCAMHITNDEINHRVMLFISIHSIVNNMLYIYIHSHKHDKNNSYIECSNTLGMKSFSTHIYVLNKLHTIRKRQDCITLLF